MLTNYLRIAARILTRNKMYTVINVLGLTLGLCACIVIWVGASFELSFDRFHPDGDRIYRVVRTSKIAWEKDPNIIPPMPAVIRKEVPGLDAVATYFTYNDASEVQVPVPGKAPAVFQPQLEGEEGQTGIVIADAGWFQLFSYQWLAGNRAVALNAPFRVVLTEKAVRLYFGHIPPAAAMGRELIYQDSLHVVVSGVVKDWAGNSDLAYTDFISFPTIDASFLKDRRHLDDWVTHQGMGRWDWPYAYVKLTKGVAVRPVERQLDRIAGANIQLPKDEKPWQYALQPLSDVHFNEQYNDNRRKAHLPTIYALAAIAIFILVLAGVNFVNLATAQSLQRAKEIGMRKVLGSGRNGLMLQFFVETGALAGVAILLAVLLVWPVMRYFRDYIPYGIRFDPLTPGNLVFLAGTWAAVTLLAGFYPARVLAGYQPVQTLKGSGSIKGGEKWWLRRSLIVFQFTISLIFIIITLVFGKQIRYMLDTDYGFRTNAIVTVQGQGNLLDTTTRELNMLEQRFRQIPGIAQVIREGNPPVGWGTTNMMFEFKRKGIEKVVANADFGDEGFIPFYGLHVLAGRNMHHSDSLTELVINESMAKQLGYPSPAAAVGQSMSFKKPLPIVGVVADFHEGSFHHEIRPMVILHEPRWERDLGIRLASAGKSPERVKATLEAMKKVYATVYPGVEMPYLFLDDSIRNMYETEQRTASLARVAMGLAIFISCMGLFGLSLFTAERRSREIGVRKVLGATNTDIALMLNRQFIRLVLLALAIASPFAWLLAHRWLQDFAYRVPVGAGLFVIAGLCAIGLSVATVSYQSIRAAMTSPIKTLKTE